VVIDTSLLTRVNLPGEKMISPAMLLETRNVLDRQLGEMEDHDLDQLLNKPGLPSANASISR
jgi:hypothetical protein